MHDFPQRMQHASGRWMTLVNDRVLVSLKGSAAAAGEHDRDNVLDALGLVPDHGDIHAGAAPRASRSLHRMNETASRVWARSRDGAALSASALAARADAGDQQAVEWIGPVYRFATASGDDYLCPLPQALLVAFDPMADEAAVKAFIRKYGLSEDAKRSAVLGKFRYFQVKDPKSASSLELIDRIRADGSGLVRDARFETMPMWVPTAYVPNDPLFGDQWNMVQIRAGGPGQTAWNLHRGDPNIIICVLDEGCDLGHPDLTYTPAPSGINLGTMLPDGGPTGNHGTPCAGIAAGNTNTGEGVAGVAGGCTVLPAAFETWSDIEVAAGIRYAANNGARVISMSFGWDGWDHDVIDPAIQEAFDANVVMCVATHNDNSDLRYPATNPLVMACGASDQADNRKSPASPDGENWGSNFGPQVSVVAPGVLCPSADRTGSVGYNTSAGAAGNYVMTFNGTSAATPHVAGLAALLLSCDSTLTNVEVRDIIEQTADKVGVVPYATVAGKPNGTWNEEMGYGRIDALGALQSVCKRHPFELKHLVLDEKVLQFEDIFKLRRFKEKEFIEEVKNRVGYENPEIFDMRVLETLVGRLERLEKVVDRGQPFINAGERPEVGAELARRARRTRG